MVRKSTAPAGITIHQQSKQIDLHSFFSFIVIIVLCFLGEGGRHYVYLCLLMHALSLLLMPIIRSQHPSFR